MSNPVPPPGSVPPPAAQPGQPVSGQPVPGQPVSGQPIPGQPAPGEPQQFFELPAETKKKSAKSRILGIVGTIVVVLVVLGLKMGLRGALDKDEAKEAKVGDCVAAQGEVPKDGKETDTGAEVVDCASAKARFTVVGRVDGETNGNSPACDKYFTEEKAEYFTYVRKNPVGGGYLLCLKGKA